MNNLITNFRDLEGLTIHKVQYDNCGELILQFTDKSVAVLKSEPDYDGAPNIILKNLNKLVDQREDDILQIIYDPDEWNIFITARRLDESIKQELSDKRQLEYLKKKYPEEFKQEQEGSKR